MILMYSTPASSVNVCTVSKGRGAVRIVTTEEVLTELLNFFGSRGCHLRRAAGELVEQMRSAPMIDVAAQTHAGFLAGCALYQVRPDKGYSLTDCISMNVMRRDGLSEVRTNDEHFMWEGFCWLLRDSLRSAGGRHHSPCNRSLANPGPVLLPLPHHQHRAPLPSQPRQAPPEQPRW